MWLPDGEEETVHSCSVLFFHDSQQMAPIFLILLDYTLKSELSPNLLNLPLQQQPVMQTVLPHTGLQEVNVILRPQMGERSAHVSKMLQCE